MLKLSTTMGKTLLYALTYMERMHPDTMKALLGPHDRDTLAATWARREQISQRLYQALYMANSGRIPKDSIKDLLDMLEAQLSHSNSHEHVEVLEWLIQTLASPGASRVLAGTTLRTLREALLYPEALEKLREIMANAPPVHCGSCGHQFQNHEIGVMDLNKESQISNIYCTTCASPVSVACSSRECDEAIPLTDAQRAAIFVGASCGKHNAKPAPATKLPKFKSNPFFRVQLDPDIAVNAVQWVNGDAFEIE